MDQTKVVTLASYISIGEAEIVKSMLESGGVHCALLHDTINTVFPYLTSGESPVKLIVNEVDLEHALEMLHAGFDQKEFDSESSAK